MDDSSLLFANSVSDPKATVIIVALIVWSVVWKGIALWKAARFSQKNWFIWMLILNTAGILEIIYIFAVARKKERSGMAANNHS